MVYLVHSLGHADFAARDRRAASIVARAAEAQHVRQIVYLGGLGDESDDLSEHLQSRRDTERHLASGSVPVTTIRAGMVVGPGSAAFDTILALVDRLPGMVCPRWVSTPTQPIAITDVARYIAGVCGNPEAIGQNLRRGRPRGHDLPPDDRTHRPHTPPPPDHHRGAVPHPETLIALAATRHPSPGRRRPTTDRRTTQPNRSHTTTACNPWCRLNSRASTPPPGPPSPPHDPAIAASG